MKISEPTTLATDDGLRPVAEACAILLVTHNRTLKQQCAGCGLVH